MTSRPCRRALGVGVAAAIALVAPATAAAHISIHPNTVPAGAFATLELRVPGEQAGAHVTQVDTLFPPGFTSVAYQPVPGWTVRPVYTRLAVPIQSDDGPIDTEVSQLIWTWTGPLGRVDNNQFIDFPLSVAIPANASGRSLAFKTVQSYSDGTVTHWIGPPTADQPAPTVNVTAPGGVIEDVAGAEAGPAPGEVPGGSSGGGSGDTLAIVALVVGALGLAAGAWALVAGRRAAT